MEKCKYDTDRNEKLTEVRVKRVWLNEYIMPEDSEFKNMFPDIWLAIQEEVEVEHRGFPMKLQKLKQLILSVPEQYILFIKTETSSNQGWRSIGQRAYLSNKDTFIDITWLMVFTNLVGCKFQIIHPPYEDFVNEFIGEVYF
jgi:hypothetical protein